MIFFRARFYSFLFCLFISIGGSFSYAQVVANFTTPDTICFGDSLSINNLSQNATTQYWNFCSGGIYSNASSTSFSSTAPTLNAPVRIAFVADNGNYYTFTINYGNGTLTRHDFGTNPLNNSPTISNFGNLGQIAVNAEGIQIKKEGANWYGFIMNPSALVRLDFGTSLSNIPTATNLGNIAGFNGSHGLNMVQDGGIWYGFVSNPLNNTLTRLVWSSGLGNAPTGANLGNPNSIFWGNTSSYFIKKNGNWYAFCTNGTGWASPPSSFLSRLDFGNSLMNAPTQVSLGNLGGLSVPYDLTMISDCGRDYAIVSNTAGNNLKVLDFSNGITGTPTIQNFNSIAGISYPEGISELRRVGDNLIGFVAQPGGGSGQFSIVRFVFSPCTSANVSSSSATFPPKVLYNQAGTYTVSLIVDEGLPTQASYCKQIVVIPTQRDTVNVPICSGKSYTLPSGNIVYTAGTYLDTLQTIRGCDSIIVTKTTVNSTYSTFRTATICSNQSYTTPGGKIVTTAGTYKDTLQTMFGCDSFVFTTVSINPSYTITRFDTICANQTYTRPKGAVVNTSGTYTDTLQTFLNCDSIIITNLFVKPVASILLDTAINTTSIGGTNGSFIIKGLSSSQTYIVQFDKNGVAQTPQTKVSNLSGKITITGLSAGLYQNIRVTFNGCTSGGIIAIIDDPDPVANFTLPDTICFGDTVNISNLSLNASSYFWNFCSGSFYNTPTVTHYPNATLWHVVRSTFVEDSGNYYTFTTNYSAASLMRQEWGNNPATGTPVFTNLGNFGILNYGIEGIQIKKDGNNWYGFIMNNTTMVRLDFGANLANTPTATNLGNIAGFNNSHGLFIKYDAGIWYGLVSNAGNSTVSRLVWGASLANTPTGTNLGNPGGYFTGNNTSINAVKKNGNWYVFVTNSDGYSNANNSRIVRLDFGNSLLNVPSAVNLGNTGYLNAPYDMTLFTDCEGIYGFITNTGGSDAVLRIDFPNGINGPAVSVPASSMTGMVRPEGISEFLRVGNSLVGFVSNTGAASISRVVFSACSSSSISVSNAANPPKFVYNQAGSYNISLILNEGLPNQVAFCKNLVVLPQIPTATRNISICAGKTYTRPSGIVVNTSGIYTDTLQSIHGCDSIIITNLTVNPTYSSSQTKTICSNQSYTRPSGKIATTSGIYRDTLQTIKGCDSIIITTLNVNPISNYSYTKSICWGQSYVFNGISRSFTGTYFDTLQNALSCDSFITLNLIVNPTYTFGQTISLCSGETYTMPKGRVVNTSGTYIDSFLSEKGCDSLVSITIIVNPVFSVTRNISICSGQNYTLPKGTIVSVTGIYRDTFQTAQYGCDSIIVTNLTVNPKYTINQTVSICSNQTYTRPKGAVVSTAGIYRDTLQSSKSCDSIIVTTLNVKPISNYSFTQSICAGQSYLFNGISRTATGTYFDTLQNAVSCDSFITLNLIVNPTYTINQNVSICANQSYTRPKGTVVSTAGIYRDTLQTIKGCDSIITINLTVNPVYTTPQTITICANQSYTRPKGTVVSTAGIYRDTLQTIKGCDSIIVTTLNVKPISNYSFTQSICAGQSYVFNGMSRTTTGTYFDTLQNAVSCDSFITLNLIVNPTYTINQNVSICSNQTYTLPKGTVVSVAGIYRDTLQTIKGCDSIIVTTLSIKSISNYTYTQNICVGQSYVFNGISRTTAGTYFDTLQNAVGCDSFITLNLIVNPVYTIPQTITICSNQSYTRPKGTVVSTVGIYRDTLQTIKGCDSIIVTTLNVKPISNYSFTQSICAGQSYVFNGVSRTTTGTYFDTLQNAVSCDSFITLNLIVNPTYTINQNISICANQSYTRPSGKIVNTNGVYVDTLQTIKGCDSIIITNLTVNPIYTVSQTITICANQSYTRPKGTVVSTAGIYRDTLQTIKGCDSIIVTTLNVKPISNYSFTQSICAGQSYVFNGVSRTATGTYFDTLQNTVSCDSFITLNLIVNPTYSFAQNKTICLGQTYTLPSGKNVSTTGLYRDTLQTTKGCDSVFVVRLSVQSPTRDTLRRTACYQYNFKGNLIKKDSVLYDTLKTTIGCDSIYRVLNIRVVNPIFVSLSTVQGCGIVNHKGKIFRNSTMYKDTIYTTQGCDSVIQSTPIVVDTIPRIDIKDKILCKDSTITILAPSYFTKYVWSNTTSDTSIIVSPTKTTKYQLTVTDGHGCTASDNFTVYLDAFVPHILASPDVTVERGTAVELTLQENNASVIKWYPTTYLTDSSINTTTYHPKEDITYYVLAKNQNNCIGIDSIAIKVYDKAIIQVPTGFSPNGDGVNDVFRVMNTGLITLKYLKVFNRWGELVFETNSIENGWDGTYKGELQPVSTFVYYIEATENATKKVLTLEGNVTLIR